MCDGHCIPQVKKKDAFIVEVRTDKFFGRVEPDTVISAERARMDQVVPRFFLKRKGVREQRLHLFNGDTVFDPVEIQMYRSGLSEHPVAVFVEIDDAHLIDRHMYPFVVRKIWPTGEFFVFLFKVHSSDW